MNAITYMMFFMLAAVAAVPKSPDTNKVQAALAKLEKQVKMLGVKEEKHTCGEIIDSCWHYVCEGGRIYERPRKACGGSGPALA